MKRPKVLHPLKRFMLRSTGYSYPNIARLFLRLFVGILLLHFAFSQIGIYAETKDVFPAVLGMGHECSLIVMVIIETVCSLFIIVGLGTRIMCVPPFVAMCVAEIYLKGAPEAQIAGLMPWQQQNYLPVMFIAIFFFLFLTGPGKISLDYMFSLRIIHEEDLSEHQELEVM